MFGIRRSKDASATRSPSPSIADTARPRGFSLSVAGLTLLLGMLVAGVSQAAWQQEKFAIGAWDVRLPENIEGDPGDTTQIRRTFDMLRDAHINLAFNGMMGTIGYHSSGTVASDLLRTAGGHGIEFGNHPSTTPTGGWDGCLGRQIMSMTDWDDVMPITAVDSAYLASVVAFRSDHPDECLWGEGAKDTNARPWAQAGLLDLFISQYYLPHNAYEIVGSPNNPYFGHAPLLEDEGGWPSPVTHWSLAFVGSGYGGIEPSEVALRGMALVPVALGAKGIVWSTFSSHHDAELAWKGLSTESPDRYDGALMAGALSTKQLWRISTINAYLENIIGPVVMSSDRLCGLHHSCESGEPWVPCGHLNAAQADRYLPSADKPLFKMASDIPSDDVMVTVWHPRGEPAGSYYLLVLNKDLVSAVSTDLRIRPESPGVSVGVAPSIIGYQGGRTYEPVALEADGPGNPGAYRFSVSLAAGEGRMFRVVPAGMEAPFARLTQPAGGEFFSAGDTVAVSWEGIVSDVSAALEVAPPSPSHPSGIALPLDITPNGQTALVILPNASTASGRVLLSGRTSSGALVTARQTTSFSVTRRGGAVATEDHQVAAAGLASATFVEPYQPEPRTVLTADPSVQPVMRGAGLQALYGIPGGGTGLYSGMRYGLGPAAYANANQKMRVLYYTLTSSNTGFNNMSSNLRLALMNGVTGWDVEDVDATEGYENPGAVAEDAAGNIWAAYNSGVAADYALRVKQRVGPNQWETLWESSPQDHPKHIQIGFDAEGATWVGCVVMRGAGALRRPWYALYRDGSQWLGVKGAIDGAMRIGANGYPEFVCAVPASPSSDSVAIVLRRLVFDSNYGIPLCGAPTTLATERMPAASVAIGEDAGDTRMAYVCNGAIREGVEGSGGWAFSDVKPVGTVTGEFGMTFGSTGRWYGYWDQPAGVYRTIRVAPEQGGGEGGGGGGECEHCPPHEMPAITLESANPTLSNGALHFAMQLPRAATVGMRLYDIAGRAASTRPDQHMAPGQHRLEWAPGGLRAGVYFLRVSVDGRESMKRRLVFIR